MGVIASFGLAAVLDGVMLIIFGSPEYAIHFSGVPTGVMHLAGARFSATSLALTGFTLVLAAIVAGCLRFTAVGRRIRAAGQDPILASQGGINVRRIYMGSWALAGCSRRRRNRLGLDQYRRSLPHQRRPGSLPAILGRTGRSRGRRTVAA